MNEVKLIELPTNKLLEKFGSGSHAPGSGSAAALMGLLAAKLIVTVAILSLKKDEYRRDHSKIDLIKKQIGDEIEQSLRDLFHRDAETFDEVIKARIERDAARGTSRHRALSETALEQLKVATEIPFSIADLCIKLIDHGASMFDMGFKGARGDTGAAISAAVAGAMSAIFVINLNLKSFRGSDWALQQRVRCDDLHRLLERKQLEALGRVMTLRAEDVTSFNFSFSENG
jgi:formiminotetrahydrofolate cyclodeaminase